MTNQTNNNTANNTNTNTKGDTTMIIHNYNKITMNQTEINEACAAYEEAKLQQQMEENAMANYYYEEDYSYEEISMEELAACEGEVDIVIDEVSVETEAAANAGTTVNTDITIEVKSMTTKTTGYKTGLIITKTMTQNQIKAARQFFAKGIIVDFDNGTLDGRKVRNYGIIRTTKFVKGKVVISGETLVNRNQLLVWLANTAMTPNTKAASAKALVFKALEQALFVEVEMDGYGLPQNIDADRLNRDQVALLNTAYVFVRVGDSVATVGLDAKTMERLIAGTELAVFPDKQANKCVRVGVGANALGVFRNGDSMFSINPINDPTKGANRVNASMSGKANSDERIIAELTYEGPDFNYVGEGIQRKVIFAPGCAILAQGMIAVNDGVSFDFYAHKQLKPCFAVATIGEEITETNFVNGMVLSFGNELTINGVVIYRHEDYTTVQLNSFKATRDGGVWCFNIDSTMIAVGKTTVKIRDFGSKGMSANIGLTVDETNEWDLLFTSESMKTAEGLLTMYTQANPGCIRGVDGVVRDVNHNVVTDATIKAWFKANGEVMTIRTPIHESNIRFIKPAVGEKVTFSAPDANGIVVATQRTFAICTNYVFNIEMASCDEVAGYRTKIDATSNVIQSLLSEKYAKQIARCATKNARKLSVLHYEANANVDFDPTAVELPLQAAATRVTALIAEHGNVQAALSAICSKGINSFKVSFKCQNGNDWVVTVPVKAFLAFGAFDVAGNAALSTTDENPIDLAVRFLTLAASGADAKTLRSFVEGTGFSHTDIRRQIAKFVENKTNSVVAGALRGPTAFYAKAIADWRIPYTQTVQGVEVPVLFVAPESPVFNVEPRKVMNENEFVVVNRTPMPASVVCALQTATFAMDANVIAINPLIMDVNHGDNDGDAISVTAPRLSGAPVAPADAVAFNNSVVSIGGYNAQLAAEKAKGESGFSTTINEIHNIATGDLHKKFSKKYFTFTNTVKTAEWATLMAKVNEVYVSHVANAYDVAFAALQQYAARVAAGDTTFAADEMLNDAMGAWTRYEDEALCGYNESTYVGMNEYLSGKGMTPFVTTVFFGLEAIKADYKEYQMAVNADVFATTAFAIRLAGKKFKAAKIQEASIRRNFLNLAINTGKLSVTSNSICAVAKAVNPAANKELLNNMALQVTMGN